MTRLFEDVQSDISKKMLLFQLKEIDGFYLLQPQTCFYLFKGPVTRGED